MRFITSFILSLCLLGTLTGQVELRVSFDRDTVLLGDTVGLNYELLVLPGTEVTAVDVSVWDSVFTIEQMQQAAADSTINWNEVYSSDSNFEILNYGKWTPSEADGLIPATGLRWKETPGQESGQKILSNRLTTVFWAEGSYIIPHAAIGFRAGNQAGVYAIPGAANVVRVQAPTVVDVSEIDTLTQLTPIKPILEEKRNWKDFLWWYVALGVLLLAFLLYKYLTRERAEEEEEEPEVILPPSVIALGKLEDLQGAELWQQGEVKEYQSRLTYVLREYLEGRYDIQALESTTSQINEDLRKAEVSETQRNKLKELLQVADLVKFAKAEPPESFHARVLEESFAFVKETKMSEEEFKAKYYPEEQNKESKKTEEA